MRKNEISDSESQQCICGSRRKLCGEDSEGLFGPGIGKEDTREIADKFIKKMINLRIFADENGKTNLSLADVDGEVLLVSQFTLYANCKKGNRPSFFEAGEPDKAEELYEYMVEKVKEYVPVVQTGTFGALMKVSLINEGPFTIILDDQTFQS